MHVELLPRGFDPATSCQITISSLTKMVVFMTDAGDNSNGSDSSTDSKGLMTTMMPELMMLMIPFMMHTCKRLKASPTTMITVTNGEFVMSAGSAWGSRG